MKICVVDINGVTGNRNDRIYIIPNEHKPLHPYFFLSN